MESTAITLSMLLILAVPAVGGPGSKDDPLVDVTSLDSTFVIEMRYARPDNFLKRTMYDRAVALLRKPVAERLARVQAELAKESLRIKVWDAYRPNSVQIEMWKLVPNEDFVANPKKGSSHGRGAAVDVTLVDAAGKELDMGTAHDDFSKKAYPESPEVPESAKVNRRKLKAAMEAHGFTQIKTEWWHFSAPEDKAYAVMDIPLSHFAPNGAPSASPGPSPQTSPR